jgi:hypothetical protein
MSRRLKILLGFGIALVVAVLIPVIHHYQLRAATEAYIARLKARGEPMDLAQVIPPPAPPEQNGADTFRKAVALFEADQGFLGTNYGIDCMRMVAPGKAMICSRQPEVHYYNYYTTNAWDVVATAVAQNQESFTLLRQLIAKPDFDFQINYDQGVADLTFTNLHLTESKRAAQRLETAALYDLHQGDTRSAVTNLQAMLAIVKAMRNERLLISELVRMAIASIAMTVNWEVLQSSNLTDEQLAELQNDWAGLDFIQAEENTLEMERVTQTSTVNRWRKSSSGLRDNLESWTDWGIGNPPPTIGKFQIAMAAFRWRYWLSYPDELKLLRGYQTALETTRRAETNYSLLSLLHEQENKIDKMGTETYRIRSSFLTDFNKPDLHDLMSSAIFALNPIFRRVMMAETTRQMAIAAIALKRYQLEHRNYPADLNSLVPEFVPKVPLDPIDGQPMRYRLSADGTVLLYSVGENGLDDGGNPGLKKGALLPSYDWLNREALDWVWPQPATEAEIRNYYAHRPK